MKRVITVMVLVLAVIFLPAFEAGAESFAYDEASFEISDELMTAYESDYCDLRFVADDDSAEFRFSQINNIDDISFAFMALDDAELYYSDYLTSFADDFEILNIQNYGFFGNCDCINLDGTFYSDKGEHYMDVYICSTDTFIYVFEFVVYEDDGYNIIYDIINSIYVFDYAAVVPEEDTSIIELIVLPLFAVVGFVVVYFSKKIAREALVGNTENNTASVIEPKKIHIKKEKFEFNGKSINALNERFTVGGNSDNFALKELERERKEREKMFK